MSDDGHAAARVREGDVLAGKYRIDKVLGVGGMGVVVAAHHLQLDDRVAIKFMLPEALSNREAVARFAREARAAVKIKSEHVAKVTDVGTLENGAPYMVMEYLEGNDLSGWLTQHGALAIEQAVEFILQACEALAQAHVLGIVHRDLKPANLFVIRRPDGALSVKVLDFGISKTTSLTGSGGESSMTKTSALMGSPLYMSPEQMQSSKNVDARTDIWAIGVILYELITGAAPFTGESMPELILQIISAPTPPIRSKRPDAPEGLEAAILKCLDKDRGRRFQTVGELAVALLPFAPKRSKNSVERISGVMMAAGLSGSALALPPSSDRTDEAAEPKPSGTVASWARTAAGGGRGRGAALLAVLGLVGVGGYAFRSLSSPKPELPASAVPRPQDNSPSYAAAPASVAPAPLVTLGVDSTSPVAAQSAAAAPAVLAAPGSSARPGKVKGPAAGKPVPAPSARPASAAPAKPGPAAAEVYDDRK